MRIALIVVSILAAQASPVSSQSEAKLPDQVSQFRSLYAVPETPAFNILDVSPNNVLRPSSVRDIAANVADFRDSDGSWSIPRAFALEFSPALIAKGKTLSLDDYYDHRELYRFRVSIATSQPPNVDGARSAAVGFRITLRDDADLRANKAYIDNATDASRILNDAIAEERKRTGPPNRGGLTLEQIEALPHIAALKKQLTDNLRQKWADENWNANITELAIAFRGASPDSVATNLKFDAMAAWFTHAQSLSTWGQLLIGAKFTVERSPDKDEFDHEGSLSANCYMGNNEYKASSQAQLTFTSNTKPAVFINLGAEFKIREGIFAEFTAGANYSSDTNDSELISKFRLNFGV